ncbi:MAG: 2Fe-2S iron-sulfur cluster-binding protein [Bilophila sp.]
MQQAFITYAGVQCGFCSPGFIMSAKGLLMRNPNPTRAEVREWFTRHGNICRCTGYKPVVDAVMAAAAVLRGKRPGTTSPFPAGGRPALRFGLPETDGAFPCAGTVRFRSRHRRPYAGRRAASGRRAGAVRSCADTVH